MRCSKQRRVQKHSIALHASPSSSEAGTGGKADMQQPRQVGRGRGRAVGALLAPQKVSACGGVSQTRQRKQQSRRVGSYGACVQDTRRVGKRGQAHGAVGSAPRQQLRAEAAKAQHGCARVALVEDVPHACRLPSQQLCWYQAGQRNL